MSATGNVTVDQLRAFIEDFLLPSINPRQSKLVTSKAPDSLLNLPSDQQISPKLKLDHILYHVSLAEQIRTLQTIYRDSFDELNLIPELRIPNQEMAEQVTSSQSQPIVNTTSNKLTTKFLTDKLCEGRARILALTRLCFGENSIEYARSILDLANAYALQGMWPQVQDHVSTGTAILNRLLSDPRAISANSAKIRVSQDAAERVQVTYAILREHAAKHRGQVIQQQFIGELTIALGKLSSSWSQANPDKVNNAESLLGHPAQLVVYLDEYFKKFDENVKSKGMFVKSTPSWGDVINYLRYECALMQSWVSETESGILPQNKATLLLSFVQCDQQHKGIAHPAQLSQCMLKSPAAAKVLAGSSMTKTLSQMNIDVSVFICSLSGQVIDVQHDKSIGRTVNYGLPILWEEVLAMYMQTIDFNPMELLKAQFLTLSGVSQIFSNRVTQAESSLREALKVVEVIGFEMEIAACELYNSIAQLMIIKYKNWHGSRRKRCEKEAEKWINSEEGKRRLDGEIEIIRKKLRNKIFGVPGLEAEMKAKVALIKSKTKELMSTEEDGTLRSIDAAFRYLMRSHEILEQVHGSNHPSVATACLAIASVKNIISDFETAREWLRNALRTMERVQPRPERAISFIQIQLAQVMLKQNYDEEAVNILQKAGSFHHRMAVEALTSMGRDGNHSQFLSTPLDKSSCCFEDVSAAIEVLTKVVYLVAKQGNKIQAFEQSVVIAKLAESAYGWDSIEAANCRKQVGIRCAAKGSWTDATNEFKRSADIIELLFGNDDANFMEVSKLYDHAISKKPNELLSSAVIARGHDGNEISPSKQMQLDFDEGPRIISAT